MHPTTLYQLANAQTADLHQRAARERTAKAVIQARRAQPHHRARLVPGHAVTVLSRNVPASFAGRGRTRPTR